MVYSDKDKNISFKRVIKAIEGGKPLRQVLKEKDTPSPATFYKWIDKDQNMLKRYVRACELRADSIFEDLLSIADDGSNDTYTDSKGRERTDQEVIGRSRLRVDARKWMLAKMNPKKYGDKTTTVHGLDEDDNITELNITIKKADK